MIIIILGGIGSGKSLTAVKEIKDSKNFPVTNFNLKKLDHKRIKYSDVIIESKKVKDYRVNWQFWGKLQDKNSNFSIYLDEVHNIIHARASMSKTNILMSKWVSQVRKILSDHPHNHLYLISQTIRKIDVDFRELAQLFITCTKIQKNKKVYIINKYYQSIDHLFLNRPMFKRVFLGNPYFKYYDSLEMVKFDDAEVYI